MHNTFKHLVLLFSIPAIAHAGFSWGSGNPLGNGTHSGTKRCSSGLLLTLGGVFDAATVDLQVQSFASADVEFLDVSGCSKTEPGRCQSFVGSGDLQLVISGGSSPAITAIGECAQGVIALSSSLGEAPFFLATDGSADSEFEGGLIVDSPTFFVDADDNEVGINTLIPGASLEIHGTLYVFSLFTQATDRAVQFQGTLPTNATVFNFESTVIHTSDVGDVYAVLGRAAKGAGRAGDVFAVEGFATDPHQSNTSRHFGITGDVRAPANSFTDTLNVGSRVIASAADINIGLWIQEFLADPAPSSGDWGVYQPSANQENYFRGDTGFGTDSITTGVSVEVEGVILTDSDALQPRPTLSTCNGTTEGYREHDSTGPALCWCDGTSWVLVEGTGPCA